MSAEGVDLHRVVAVVVGRSPTARVGSGFLVAAGVVLTADHVCADAPAASVRVIAARGGRRMRVREIVRPPDPFALDLAVVLLDDKDDGGTAAGDMPLTFARLNRTRSGAVQDCTAVGFPGWQFDPHRRSRDPAELHGVVYRGEGAAQGRLVFRDCTISGVGEGGWRGMSGALLAHRGAGLGVVVAHHPRQGVAALQAVTMERAAQVLVPEDAPPHRLAALLGLLPAGHLPEVAAEEGRLVVEVGQGALGLVRSPAGTIVDAVPRPLLTRRPPPVRVLGRAPRACEGRDRERELARRAAASSEVIGFAGPTGCGKSTLLRRVARDVADAQPGADVVLVSAASAQPGEVLAEAAGLLVEADVHVHPTPTRARAILADWPGVVLLDDVELDAAGIGAVLDGFAEAAVVVALRAGAEVEPMAAHGPVYVLAAEQRQQRVAPSALGSVAWAGAGPAAGTVQACAAKARAAPTEVARGLALHEYGVALARCGDLAGALEALVGAVPVREAARDVVGAAVSRQAASAVTAVISDRPLAVGAGGRSRHNGPRSASGRVTRVLGAAAVALLLLAGATAAAQLVVGQPRSETGAALASAPRQRTDDPPSTTVQSSARATGSSQQLRGTSARAPTLGPETSSVPIPRVVPPVTATSRSVSAQLKVVHPWVTIAPVIQEATSASGAIVTISADARDATGRPVVPECSPSSGSEFPLGTTTVTCEVLDSSSRVVARATGTVTVTDTRPPTLFLPHEVSVHTWVLAATPTWSASAEDLVSSSPILMCDPPSGQPMALSWSGNGSTLTRYVSVACWAVDDSGNRADGSFRVVITIHAPG